MHDAARLVPLGESLAVVLRTGRNAIVAYRLDPYASGAYKRSWRTLLEPGSSNLAVGTTSGSFDVFGQLQNHIRVFVDVDSGAPAKLGAGLRHRDWVPAKRHGHRDLQSCSAAYSRPHYLVAERLLRRTTECDHCRFRR